MNETHELKDVNVIIVAATIERAMVIYRYLGGGIPNATLTTVFDHSTAVAEPMYNGQFVVIADMPQKDSPIITGLSIMEEVYGPFIVLVDEITPEVIGAFEIAPDWNHVYLSKGAASDLLPGVLAVLKAYEKYLGNSEMEFE